MRPPTSKCAYVSDGQTISTHINPYTYKKSLFHFTKHVYILMVHSTALKYFCLNIFLIYIRRSLVLESKIQTNSFIYTEKKKH